MKRKLTKIQIKKRGFSLVELVAVITIIGILATIGVVSFTRAQRSARDGRRKADLQAIQTALGIYYSDQGRYRYPSPEDTCVSSKGSCGSCPCGVSDWSRAVGTFADELEPTYIKRLPVDPNNENYYYSYRVVCGGAGTVCGVGVNCPSACCEYELLARLEDGSTFSLCSP